MKTEQHLVIHHPENDVLNQLQDHTQVLFGYEIQNNRLVEGWRKACGREEVWKKVKQLQ